MNKLTTYLILGLSAGISASAWANESAMAASDSERLDTFTLIGSEEERVRLPSSAVRIDAEDLAIFEYQDINQILKNVPGVYLRQEDGYGLFPNISIRGVDPGRSSKVTLMEDGILTAPAPYSAPSAYYSPTAGRMDGFEVLKGSSQVKYGPHTTGGAINYLSTPIPQQSETTIKGEYGSDNFQRWHLTNGNLLETSAGKFGYLVEWYREQADGFKTINGTASSPSSDDTGYEKNDYMIKLSYQPDTAKYHYFEGKIGYSDFDSQETYLGISTEDFNRDPYQRYAATRFDQIRTNQTRSYLRHVFEASNDLTFTTTAYYNQFHRNWYKLQDVNGSNLSTALFNDTENYNVLNGTSAGSFDIRANNRDYYLGGIQSNAEYLLDSGDISHKIETGIRLHRDRIRRFQREDSYTQDNNGAITEIALGEPGGAGNRRQESTATALHLQDEISWRQWTFLPGIRYEHIEYDYQRFADNSSNTLDAARSGTSDLDVWAAGMGVSYQYSDQTTFFGGLYRGYSVPDANGSFNGLGEESSLSVELGYRFDDQRGIQAEIVAFHTQFKDLLVIDNIGNGNNGDTQNAGEIDSTGLEVLLGYDHALRQEASFRTPITLALTYTNAELANDSNSDDNQESIFFGGRKGNEVPFIPQIQFTLTAGIEKDKWGAYLSGNYVDSTWATAANNSAENGNARNGRIDSYFTVDGSLSYQAYDNLRIFASVSNLFDEEYIVSRLPHGPRSGAPRLFSVGFESRF